MLCGLLTVITFINGPIAININSVNKTSIDPLNPNAFPKTFEMVTCEVKENRLQGGGGECGGR